METREIKARILDALETKNKVFWQGLRIDLKHLGFTPALIENAYLELLNKKIIKTIDGYIYMNTTTTATTTAVTTNATETAIWAYVDDRKTEGEVCYLSSLISDLGLFSRIPKVQVIDSINNILAQNALLVQVNNNSMVTLARPAKKVSIVEPIVLEGQDEEVLCGMMDPEPPTTVADTFDDVFGTGQIDIEDVIATVSKKELVDEEAQKMANEILAELAGAQPVVSVVPVETLHIVPEVVAEVAPEAYEVPKVPEVPEVVEVVPEVLELAVEVVPETQELVDVAIQKPLDVVEKPKKKVKQMKKQTKQIKASVPKELAAWFENLTQEQKEQAEDAMSAALATIKKQIEGAK